MRSIRVPLTATLVCGLVVVATGSAAPPTLLKVPSRADLFAAGLAKVPAMSGGAGVVPPSFTFKAGARQVLVFTRVGGHLAWGSGSPSFGPAGDTAQNTDVASLGGISGLKAPGGLVLAGVFLGDGTPRGRAPARVVVTDPTKLTTVAPRLQQVFYVGDGKAGGTPRSYAVPPTATHLYLGFVDGFAFHGPPGYYDDNTGSLTVNFKLGRS
jgi:hypothetical protein